MPNADPETSDRRASRGHVAGLALAGAWLATLGLFLAGAAMPAGLSRPVAAATVLATVVLAGAAWARLWAPARRPWGPALAVLVAVAAPIALLGLDHEAGLGYYADEGHYLSRARRVAGGELLFPSFIYPHLLYYLDGLALWLAGLFPGATDRLLQALFTFDDPAAADWLVLRVVTALLGAGTAVPAFLLARRAGGALAGLLAGGLTLFAVSYHDGYQVNTCDVPAAFFATLCLAAVGRLVERESTRGYLAAGVAAGLAAGTKYPAGVVAVAIAGVWALHRLRDRRLLHPGLAWAAAAAVAAFLAAVPSLLAHPEAALHGQRGLLFGVRQYGQGGWTGVTPPSNALWYGERLLHDLGLPALLLAAAGFAGLEPRRRRFLLALLPFPVVYLALIVSMNMVVARNLFPVLPALAVVAGVAASGLPRLLAARWPRLRPLAAAAVAVAALAAPAWATGRQALALDRPSTRQAMAAWVREHVPRGAGILKESYTPSLDPAWYRVAEQRFAIRFREERWRDPRFQYLLLASHAHDRFFDPRNDAAYQAAWYRDVFARHRLVHVEGPGPLRRGPLLRLYRLAGDGPPARGAAFTAADAFLPDGAMAGDGAVVYSRPGQFAVFAGSLARGRYEARIEGSPAGPGELRLRSAENVSLATVPLDDGVAAFDLARPETVLAQVFLPVGSRLRRLTLAPRP